MPQGWSLPAALLAAVLLFLLVSRMQQDTRVRAENAGVSRTVAIVNEERLRQLETELAGLRSQRNQAWQAEEWLRAEKEKLHDQIDTLSARNALLSQPVPADILCLANAAIELERGEPVSDCTAGQMPGAADQPRWNDLEAMAGYAGDQR